MNKDNIGWYVKIYFGLYPDNSLFNLVTKMLITLSKADTKYNPTIIIYKTKAGFAI